jgi:hypothetical protein
VIGELPCQGVDRPAVSRFAMPRIQALNHLAGIDVIDVELIGSIGVDGAVVGHVAVDRAFGIVGETAVPDGR